MLTNEVQVGSLLTVFIAECFTTAIDPINLLLFFHQYSLPSTVNEFPLPTKNSAPSESLTKIAPSLFLPNPSMEISSLNPTITYSSDSCGLNFNRLFHFLVL